MSKRILLVSGHVSGYNACKETGVNEGDLNIELLRNVQALIGNAADVDVYPVERDWYKDNKAGKSLVDPQSYDYIFEIHFNAGKGNGCSIYLHSDYTGGVSVERSILNRMADLGVRLRGDNGFNRKSTLLNCNICQKAGVDYALIETLFYDNPANMSWYASHKVDVAKAIAYGICSGFGLDAEAADSAAEDSDGRVYTYRVQVGSFKDKEKAEALAESLEAMNYDVYVTKVLVQ